MSFTQMLRDKPGNGAETPERRTLRRNRVLLAASLVHGPHKFTSECTIRNLTEQGAAVRFDSHVPLPPTLSLVETRTGRAHDARIVWRRGGFIGLELSNSRELRAAAQSEPLRRLWAVNQLR
ncbi:MAG: hypothetical protein M3M95_03555 [Pseudomonadota bacterium]|nr:hypothetical protein [Pseudomonadota bacterium]